MVARSAEEFAVAERVDSGSARVDCSAPADSAALKVGDCSAPAAQLDGSARVDCSAVSASADSVERDWSRPDARSEQAGCSGGSPAAHWRVGLVWQHSVDSQAAYWRVGLAWQYSADWQAAHYRVDPVWQYSVGSRAAYWRVGLVWQHSADWQAAHYRVDPVSQHPVGSQVGSAGSPDGPCSVSPVFLEAPASPSVASQSHWPDASFALRSSPTVGRDALLELAAVLQTVPAEVVASSSRSPAGSSLPPAERSHDWRSQPSLQVRSPVWGRPLPSHSQTQRRSAARSRQPLLGPRAAHSRRRVAEPPSPHPVHSCSRKSHS